MPAARLPLCTFGAVAVALEYETSTRELLAIHVDNPTARSITVTAGSFSFTASGSMSQTLPAGISFSVAADKSLFLAVPVGVR